MRHGRWWTSSFCMGIVLVTSSMPLCADEPVILDEPRAAADLKPNTRYIRTYSSLKDWHGKPMTYWVSMPPEYDPAQRYPILIEWPGKGGGPQTRVFTKTYEVTGHVHVGLNYPEGNRDGGPMLYATPEYVKFVRHVYDDVVAHFNGDGEYVFLGGFSAGGYMTTGPGISLMMRADLSDKLAGVLAGGCNWMCDPRYVHGVDVLLWYSDGDPNSSDLPRRLPELRKYAESLTVVHREGDAHRTSNAIEGPAVRRFLSLHGPERSEFSTLYEIETALKNGIPPVEQLKKCEAWSARPTAAGTKATNLLAQVIEKLDTRLQGRKEQDGASEVRKVVFALIKKYQGIATIERHLREQLGMTVEGE